MGLDDTDRLAGEIEDLRANLMESHRTTEGVDESEHADEYRALDLAALLLREVSVEIEDGTGDSQLIADVAELVRERESEMNADHPNETQ